MAIVRIVDADTVCIQNENGQRINMPNAEAEILLKLLPAAVYGVIPPGDEIAHVPDGTE